MTALVPTRSDIERLEHYTAQLPQVEVPLTHRFAAGLYCREILIPADTLMTGKVHLAEHVSIMLDGDMSLLTDDGVRRVHGPQVWITPPGVKRCGYAHTDTRWLTVHANPDDENDVELLEARYWEVRTVQSILAEIRLGAIA